MSIRAFWRRFKGYKQHDGYLTVDVGGEDVSSFIQSLIAAHPEARAQAHIDTATLERIVAAFISDGAYREMEPVRLSEPDWACVLEYCQLANSQIAEAWPTAIALRIMAEFAKAHPKG